MSSQRTACILGSTGSIGCSTVDLMRSQREGWQVRTLVGGRNAERLAGQAIELGVQRAVIADPAAYEVLRERLVGTGIETACGAQAAIDAAAEPADWTMAAITGAVGLAPTLAAIRRGQSVALANKEALVCAGDVMLAAVAEAGATLLPVDSEHNAIFQAMADGNPVEKIVLTASGGPFRTASIEAMARARVEDALKHPTWTMGAKITIDSSTLFNKGLEVIEAARLFAMDESRIGVIVHPQSVVHGFVQYADGSVLAQLGAPDMRVPIAHCMAWPGRIVTSTRRLDLTEIARLDFEAPDEVRFPALRLARESLRAGGAASAILSAANEVAVEAFLARAIGFLDIAAIVEATMERLGAPAATTLDAVNHWDSEARRVAGEERDRRLIVAAAS